MNELKKHIEIAEKKKSKILELSSYLENGVYSFDENFRSVFSINNSKNPIISKFKKGSDINFPIEIKSHDPKSFNGSLLWFCINGDIKIFSDIRVLTICLNKNSYLKKLENYNYFSSFFRIPKLINKNAQDYILTEELIFFTNKNSDNEVFILETIYDDYCSYFKKLTLGSNVEYMSFNNLLGISSNIERRDRFKNITDKINPEFLTLNLPFIPLHGDLWSENILLSDTAEKKTLWCIDWETAGQYIFFFDFFKFMWNELDVHHDASYYKKYFLGGYDEKLTIVFSIFGLKFIPEYRLSYFCLFFLNYLLKDNDNIAFKYKLEELSSFEDKVLQLLSGPY